MRGGGPNGHPRALMIVQELLLLLLLLLLCGAKSPREAKHALGGPPRKARADPQDVATADVLSVFA